MGPCGPDLSFSVIPAARLKVNVVNVKASKPALIFIISIPTSIGVLAEERILVKYFSKIAYADVAAIHIYTYSQFCQFILSHQPRCLTFARSKGK